MNGPPNGRDAELAALRQEIDSVDEQMVNLLNKRIEIAQRIGRVKKDKGLSVVDFSRERAVLSRVASLNNGPLPQDTLRLVYAEVMAAARKIQKPVKVAYFGPEATFTHLAATRHFGQTTSFVPQVSIADVFDEVEKSKCEYGVVPVENSIEGAVNHTLDLLYSADALILAEIYTPIVHELMSKGAKIEDIKRVYSHPQPLAQCRAWLRRHLPNAELIEAASTSEAARLAVKEPGTAAIASSLAAVVYDLDVLASHIQDATHNATRFLVIGKDKVSPTGNDKTSILFATAHVPGALYHALQPISESGINMVKLESRPSKSASWHYLFYVDLVGHIEDEIVKGVLEKMQPYCAFIKWLGSYPISENV